MAEELLERNLPPPELDSRSARDVLKQAVRLAQEVYFGPLRDPGTRRWEGAEDENDPGHQLLIAFSRLMKILTERLNQMPDKNFLAFLDMVGVEAAPGVPARVPVTFLPSAKAPEGGPIPAGTQVATTQSERSDAHVFETVAGIYATSSKLVSIVNLLPSRDEFSLPPVPAMPPKPALPGAPEPASVVLSERPDAGVKRVPHVLYLGGEALFGNKEALDVTLAFELAEGGDPQSFFRGGNLEWRKYDAGGKEWVALSADAPVTDPPTVVLRGLERNGKYRINGQEDYWVEAVLQSDLDPAAMPLLKSIQGSLGPALPSGSPELKTNAPVERAFANATPVDLTRPFKPFGDRPRYGDAFYLSSSRAFGPNIERATLSYELKAYSATALALPGTKVIEWQYLGSEGWAPLTVFKQVTTNPPERIIVRDNITPPTKEDGTFFGQGNTAAGSFEFILLSKLSSGKVAGVEGLWLRALLKSDDPYGSEATTTVEPSPAGTPPRVLVTPSSLVPPIVEKLRLDVTYRNERRPVPRIVTENNFALEDHSPRTGTAVAAFPIFSRPGVHRLTGFAGPVFGEQGALYLAFDRPFGNVYVSLYFKLSETFPSLSTPAEQGQPSLVWEYVASDSSSPISARDATEPRSYAWKALDVRDDTAQLTASGTVAFTGPADAVPVVLFGTEKPAANGAWFWYRARLARGSYDHPPALEGIYPNTVLAENRTTLADDWVLGSGSGERNQRLALLKTPVLGGELWVREAELPAQQEQQALEEEYDALRSFSGAPAGPSGSVSPMVDVRVPAQPGQRRAVWVHWLRVPNFLTSTPRSRHYTLDAVSGELRFGDGKQGLLPPVDKDNLVLRGYRSGGGEAAARAAVPLAIGELKSSLPYVERVFNVEAASGGSEHWSLPQIFRFGPRAVKNKGRAVLAEDYESMVLERFSEVARAKCLPAQAPGNGGLVRRPGAVTLVVVPTGSEPLPRPPAALLRQVRDFIVQKCLGTLVSDVHVIGPDFRVVTVHARLRARDPRESAQVERRATLALQKFFHPLYGGEARRGWDFGRDVQLSEVFAILQRIEGVEYVRSAEFVGEAEAGASSIRIDDKRLVASGSHRIEVA